MKNRLPGFLACTVLLASCVYHDIKIKVNCDINPIIIEVTDTVNASVCGARDGALVVNATGGKAPYMYLIDGLPAQTTSTFTDLSSGFHTIVVMDEKGCANELDSVLVSVEQFEAEFIFGDDNQCLTDNGSMQINVLESNGPYLFKLDEGDLTSSNVFESLKFGKHYLTIQDNDGCNFQKLITVPRGQTSVSWENDVLPIMTTACAKSGCHNGISRSNDWRDYTQVKNYAATIKAKILDGSMPFDDELPAEQIALIVCWVDDGALEN